MFRIGIRLSIAVAALAAIAQAQAMTLGDVSVFSSLNQPLYAEVPVQRQPSDPALLNIQPAPADAYAQAGIARPALPLDSIRLSWTNAEDGVSLTLRSSERVTEPTLTLLLDLQTTLGEQRFALDLLIDSSSPGAPSPAESVYGPVRRGETLSVIAEHLAQKRGSSLSSMIGALKRLNPQAFAGSVHALLQGAVLTVPSPRDLAVQAHMDQATPWYAAPSAHSVAHPGVAPATGRTHWWWRSAEGKPALVYVSDLMFGLEVGFWSYRELAEQHFRALHATESHEPWLFQLDWTLESVPVRIDPETDLDTLRADAETNQLGHSPLTETNAPIRAVVEDEVTPGLSGGGAPAVTASAPSEQRQSIGAQALKAVGAFAAGLLAMGAGLVVRQAKPRPRRGAGR